MGVCRPSAHSPWKRWCTCLRNSQLSRRNRSSLNHSQPQTLQNCATETPCLLHSSAMDMGPFTPSSTIFSFSHGLYLLFALIYNAWNNMTHNYFYNLSGDARNISLHKPVEYIRNSLSSWFTSLLYHGIEPTNNSLNVQIKENLLLNRRYRHIPVWI